MVNKKSESTNLRTTSVCSASTSKSTTNKEQKSIIKMAATSRQTSKRQHSSTRKQAEFYKISEEKLHEYKEAFNMLDENCDGLISADEIKSMFAKIEQPISDDEVKIMLKEIDLDGNEFIDLDEFIQMMIKYETRSPEQYEISLRKVFEIFDLDKNSFITETELKEVMAKLGEHLSDEEVADMIRVADEDGDGRINFNEFRTIMENFMGKNKSNKLTSGRLNRSSNQNVNEKHVKKK